MTDSESLRIPGLLSRYQTIIDMPDAENDVNNAENDDAEVPDLGEDMLAIRARVLGRENVADDDMTEDDHRDVYNEIKKQRQIDLNDEENAVTLEDPTLVGHMEQARVRLAEQHREMLKQPKIEDLRFSYLKAMGAMSELIRGMDDTHMSATGEVEVGHAQAAAPEKLLNGMSAHGYPPLLKNLREREDISSMLTTMAKKNKIVANAFSSLLNAHEEAKQEVFVLRRRFETVCDGLLRLIEESEKDRQLMKEYVLIAEKSPAAKAAAAPAHTLGEKLIAESRLPEKTGLKGTAYDN